MIICSKAADVITRRAVGKENVMVHDIKAIIGFLTVDPAVGNQVRDAFVISETDLCSKAKVRQEFMQAVHQKHPKVKVIVIARQKSIMSSGDGIDIILPAGSSPDALSSAIERLVNNVSAKVPGVVTGDISEPSDSFIPEEFREEPKPEVEFEPQKVEEPVEEAQKEFVIPDVEMPKEAEPLVTNEDAEERMRQRLKNCNQIADVAILTREINATKIVKELLEENNEYVAIEEKLKAIQQKIYSIMADPVMSLEDKLTKVRALSYDKNMFAAKGTTILEQRVEGIITAICGRTEELLAQKSKDIDKAIIQYDNSGELIDMPRLAGLLDTRANLMLDIAVLEKEINQIATASDKIISDVNEKIILDNTQATGSDLVDNQLKARGAQITSKEGLDAINNVFKLAVANSSKYDSFAEQVEVFNRKVVQLFKTDDAIIEAQADIIRYLKAHNVEELVVANTAVKRALRIYVGHEGVGRTSTTYIASKLKSRCNHNVLYIDLTGQSKLADYGVGAVDLSEWLESGVENKFCAVVGNIEDADQEPVIQRISNAINKAADYYSVINVVIRPDQKVLFDVLAPDTLSVNYIAGSTSSSLRKMRDVITEFSYANVAQRVIVVGCEECTENMVGMLGLMDRMDVELLMVPYIPQIVRSGLYGVDPSVIDVVEESFKEVFKRA